MGRRSGPLRELPLDRFLSPKPNISITPTKSTSRPHKRPLSPGSPAIFSPAKRRILNEEGIFLSAAKLKSPLSPCASNRAASSYFHELLQGPDSPVKRLDFSSVRARRTELGDIEALRPEGSTAKPRTRGSSTPPALSEPDLSRVGTPESKIVTSSTIHNTPKNVYDDCFSPRNDSTNCQPSSPYSAIRCEPIPCDPQSIHYPGFNVCLDAHYCVPGALPFATTTAQADKGPGHGSGSPVQHKDVEKENIAPRSRPSCTTPDAMSLTATSMPTLPLQGGVGLSDGHRKGGLRGQKCVERSTPSSKKNHDKVGARKVNPLSSQSTQDLENRISLTSSRSFAGKGGNSWEIGLARRSWRC